MTERDCKHGRLGRSCEICELENELSISDDLREKMASILTRSVNAIRGEPETLHRHSWHDLPELIDEVKVDLLEARLDSQKANDTITRLQCEARVMPDCAMEEEIDDLKYELGVAREAQQCECSSDDACRFARERDALQKELADAKLVAMDNVNWFDSLKADYDKLVAERDALLMRQGVEIAELKAELAALTQQSFDLCPQCGWRTFIPGDGCLNCMTEDAKEKAE